MSAVLEMWVVYRRPTDFPDGYVARKWDITPEGPKATDETVKVNGTTSDDEMLEGVRMTLTTMHPDLVRMPRQDGDDPVIVEVWV